MPQIGRVKIILAEPNHGFGGMIPVGALTCVAEAPKSVKNWFYFRFFSCVAGTPQSPPSGYESTTRIVCESLAIFLVRCLQDSESLSLSLHNLHQMG